MKKIANTEDYPDLAAIVFRSRRLERDCDSVMDRKVEIDSDIRKFCDMHGLQACGDVYVIQDDGLYTMDDTELAGVQALKRLHKIMDNN